jgi:proteasome lid subunit RPN8/RPN11
VRDAILAQAQAALPYECVGLIVGKSWETARTLAIRNVAERPETAYLAEPQMLLNALKALDANDELLLAIYHSHPQGPATPSASDLREARYDVPQLIVVPATGAVRAFRLAPDRYEELAIGSTAL